MPQHGQYNPPRNGFARRNGPGRPQRPGGGGGYGGQPAPEVTAAYNFVPTSTEVIRPDWQQWVSHDLPLEDGLCAELDITVHAHTPLLVGGSRGEGGQVSFHSHPDGVPAIPGSSLRGMLRNVLEIATFSRLSLMDDRWLSLRDLRSPTYRGQMTATEGNVHRAKAQAGWLRFEEGQWKVYPCDHGRVSHHVLSRDLQVDVQRAYRSNNEYCRTVPWKYGLFRGKLQVVVSAEEWNRGPQTYPSENAPLKLSYRRLFGVREKPQFVVDGEVECRLVLTGQPGPGPGTDRDGKFRSGKDKEFLFSVMSSAEPVVVDANVWRAFVQVHGGASRAGASAWEWYQKEKPFGELGVPVFYLSDGAGGIRALGLAQMFRLAFDKSLKGYTGQSQTVPEHLPFDFAQTLFGWVGSNPDDESLKGRVSFGDCRLVNENRVAPPDFCRPTVLASPKPSYYPTYVDQSGQGGGRRTLLDGGAKLSGWKRYPAHRVDQVTSVPAAPAGTQDMTSQLRPLDKGRKFKGRVRVHNVSPVELGAVLWALEWGDNPALRHGLGMGKALGLGQVSIKVDSMSARTNRIGGEAPSKADLLRDFKDWMKKKLPRGWETSPQMNELLAMADPNHPGAQWLKTMHFDMRPAGNEFQQGKRGNGLPRHSTRR